MIEKGLVKAGDTEEITEGHPKSLVLNGESVVVFCAAEQYFAVRNRCPHQQFERLHEGEVDDTIVTCPMHGWKFDLRTGISLNGSGRLKIFGTVVKNGLIMVECDGEG